MMLTLIFRQVPITGNWWSRIYSCQKTLGLPALLGQCLSELCGADQFVQFLHSLADTVLITYTDTKLFTSRVFF